MTTYRLLHGSTAKELEVHVNRLLSQGWKLHSGTYANSFGHYQPMTKLHSKKVKP